LGGSGTRTRTTSLEPPRDGNPFGVEVGASTARSVAPSEVTSRLCDHDGRNRRYESGRRTLHASRAHSHEIAFCVESSPRFEQANRGHAESHWSTDRFEIPAASADPLAAPGGLRAKLLKLPLVVFRCSLLRRPSRFGFGAFATGIKPFGALGSSLRLRSRRRGASWRDHAARSRRDHAARSRRDHAARSRRDHAARSRRDHAARSRCVGAMSRRDRRGVSLRDP
jgi:hypothetical protein